MTAQEQAQLEELLSNLKAEADRLKAWSEQERRKLGNPNVRQIRYNEAHAEGLAFAVDNVRSLMQTFKTETKDEKVSSTLSGH